MNKFTHKNHHNSQQMAVSVSFSLRFPKSLNPVPRFKRLGQATVEYCKRSVKKLRLFSISKHRTGRRLAVAVNFTLPVLKPLNSASATKSLIIAIPLVFFSLLLNNHYHFFQSRSDAGDTVVSIEQATATAQQPKPPTAKKPPRTKVVVPELKFKTVKGYQPSGVTMSIPQTFRGSHKIYVYAAHETLQFSFDKVDLNRYYGPDEMTVRVAKVKTTTVAPKKWKIETFVEDDGIILDQEKHGQSQHVAFSIPVGSSGVYLIDIATNEDVLIERITSRQHLLAFDEQIYLAEGPAYTKTPFAPLTLATDSTTLAFSPNHYTGRQVIRINDQEYYLYNVRADQVVTDLNGTTIVEVPKGDAIFKGDGLFAVWPAELIPIAKSKRVVKVAGTGAWWSTTDNVLAGNY